MTPVMMSLLTTIRQWIDAMTDVIAPRRCAVCHRVLGHGEQWLCRACLEQMPLTGYHSREFKFNPMEQLFAGRVPIERATALFHYRRGDPYASILHDIKYRHTPLLGTWLMERYARQLQQIGWLDGITAVVPVPLHRSKLASRGYNQALLLARGVAQAVPDIEVIEAVKAIRAHATQTHKNAIERQKNVQGCFAPTDDAATRLADRHILLVDDVVTTGSTLEACAQVLLEAVPGLKISIISLAGATLD